MDSVVEAVNKFVLAADWLTDEDAPAVTMLRNCAESLDQTYQAAMVNQCRMLFRELKRKQPGSSVADEAEDFLASL